MPRALTKSWLASLGMLLAPTPSVGEIVELSFEGTVVQAGGTLTMPAGSPFTVTIRFDTSTAGVPIGASNPEDLHEYLLQSPPSEISIDSAAVGSPEVVFIENSSIADVFEYVSDEGGGARTRLAFRDLSATAFADGSSLPMQIDPADFTDGVLRVGCDGGKYAIGSCEGVGQLFPCPTPRNGLVGEWTFSGNAMDTSGQGNHGVVIGAAPATDRFGAADSAYSFDGIDDFIQGIGDPLPTSERTVALWFHADSVANRPCLVAYGGAGGPPGTSWIQCINIGGQQSYHRSTHWGSHAIDYFYPMPPINAWHHFAVTTDQSAGTKLYVDGIERASNTTFVDNTVAAGTDLAIGVAVSGGGTSPFADSNVDFFDGRIDDVLIYDRALSLSEIRCLNGDNPIRSVPAFPFPAWVGLWTLVAGLGGALGLRSSGTRARGRGESG